jgi:hypothetical protein
MEHSGSILPYLLGRIESCSWPLSFLPYLSVSFQTAQNTLRANWRRWELLPRDTPRIHHTRSSNSLSLRWTVECPKIRIKTFKFTTSLNISIKSKFWHEKSNNYISSCIFSGSYWGIFLVLLWMFKKGQVQEFPKFKILKINTNSRMSKDSRKDIWIYNISKNFDFLEIFGAKKQQLYIISYFLGIFFESFWDVQKKRRSNSRDP